MIAISLPVWKWGGARQEAVVAVLMCLILFLWLLSSFDQHENESRRNAQVVPPSPHHVPQLTLKLA